MIDCVVVGGGQAGLAASWHLAHRGIEHVVLEQGRVAETWRTQRWDSFALNTPAWAGLLPGETDTPGPRDEFLARDAWVGHLDRYASRFGLPLRIGAQVAALEARPGGGFRLTVSGSDSDVLEARSVVLANGYQRVPRVPALASGVPSGIRSIHSAEYRRPEGLPPGGVLVVGSAQSGGQIAEDLLDAGRRVWLSVSAVGRFPRRHRGRDIFEWLMPSGFGDQRVDQLPDPRLQFAAQPLISGVGPLGHSLSLQLLAERGATLVGRLRGIAAGRLHLDPDLASSIRFGDRFSAEVKGNIDRGIEASGRAAPPAQPDPGDTPVADPDAFTSPEELDLAGAGIGTLIWATGFGTDLAWVRLPVTDTAGRPLHDGGRTAVPGVWVLGVPWQRKRKSGIIFGADEDAGVVADQITEHLAR